MGEGGRGISEKGWMGGYWGSFTCVGGGWSRGVVEGLLVKLLEENKMVNWKDATFRTQHWYWTYYY